MYVKHKIYNTCNCSLCNAGIITYSEVTRSPIISCNCIFVCIYIVVFVFEAGLIIHVALVSLHGGGKKGDAL